MGEGCRHKCAFCTIPSIRGGLKSLTADDIADEARALLAQGVRELDLVAQDLTSWGVDLGLKHGLPSLLEKLVGLEGLAWLRLLYLYPTGVTPELLRFIRDCGAPLLPYLDIPLQHAHPDVLSRMRAGERNRLEGLVVSEGRFDAESLDFHERVRQGYRVLAEEEPERFAIIDASQPPEDVVLQCRSAIESHLRQRGWGLE